MTPAFAALVGPLIQHVVDLRAAFRNGESPSPESVKRGLIRAFGEAQGRATESQAADLALAQYPLVYWADEVLIRSDWHSADRWKNSILELDYYGTRQAAIDFWRRARLAEDQAAGPRQRGSRAPRNADVLEVFFLCVALGFRGELFLDEAEVEAWSARVVPILRAAAEGPEGRPPAAPRRPGLPALQGERRLVGASLLVAATAVLTLLGFIAAVHQRGT